MPPQGHPDVFIILIVRMKMDLIIACDVSGGIGYNGRLPWPHCKNDMRRYMSVTKGRVKLVSQTTLDTLPKNISNLDEYKLISRSGMDLDTAAVMYPDAIIVSGATIYEHALSMVDTVYLTKFLRKYECDTFIKLPPSKVFSVREYQTFHEDNVPHEFVTLTRR